MALEWKIDLARELHSRLVSIPNAIYLNEAGGWLFPMNASAVWCYRCQTFSAGERIRSVAEIELEKASFHRGEFPYEPARMEFVYGGIDQAIDRHTRSWERELQWQKERRSPPKCLACGATELLHFDWTNPASLVEPSSGRGFTLQSVFATGDSDWQLSLYSTEGDFLARIDSWDHERNEMLHDGSDPQLVISRLNRVRASDGKGPHGSP
jgi:hypothetical protein